MCSKCIEYVHIYSVVFSDVNLAEHARPPQEDKKKQKTRQDIKWK